MDERVQSYWDRYKREEDEKARNLLIEAYAPFVRQIAYKMAICLPRSVQLEDLISCGFLGLIRAVEKFDPAMGIKFEPYAITYIRGAILDELRSLDWVPRSMRQTARKLRRVCSRLECRLGRPAEDEEIARELGVGPDELQQMLTEANGTSLLRLDESLPRHAGDTSITLGDLVANLESPDPGSMVEVEETKRILIDALDRLPEQERLTIALYYYEKLSLKEIAAVLGLSENRVSQIHTRAIMRLRARLGRIENGLAN